MTSAERRLFVEQYGRIRTAEGRGSSDHDYYRALPFAPPDHRLAAQWKIRAITYRYFVDGILPREPQRILDLGAGNGWLSNRLTERGHSTVAIDIFRDSRDGLGAVRHYPTRFHAIEAEFDHLPLPPAQFDFAVFNASLHYSADYKCTLGEARRCLKPAGRIVILDSPVYKLASHGETMREERQRSFEHQYGFRSEALRSIEFLDESTLARLARDLRLKWTIHRPWYGLAWHTRPLMAALKRRRPPSRFWILEARFV